MVFVLVHGAFVGAWTWERVAPLLREAGHTVLTPTLKGLGERANELCAEISLETHIGDLTGLLREQSLQSVALVGHSYAGLVITGVAEKVPEQIAEVIYLDAVIPDDGDSLFSIAGAEFEQQVRELTCTTGNGWRMPPIWTAESLGLIEPADCMSFNTRRTPQSIKTYEEPLGVKSLTGRRARKGFIFCSAEPTGKWFLPFYQRAQTEGWSCRSLATSHLPMFSMPRQLADLLLDITTESRACPVTR